MRRLITVILILSVLLVVLVSLMDAASPLLAPLQGAALVLLALVIVDRLTGLFRVRRGTRIATSQIAEMERLYFRSMREMLNDQPNLVQVVNDLQRILSIDSRYKNARHYLNRALLMQSENALQSPNGYPRAVDFLKIQEQLIDPDPAVRKSVVMELIQFGNKAVDPLIALLMDEDGDVRVHAATALGWVGGEEAVQPLLVALQDSNPYVRRYAARALCWVVNDDAIDGLVLALRDEDNYVRRYAARALGWSRNRNVIRPLLELLAYENNSDVREYTLIALEDLGERNVQVERPLEVNEA